MKPLRASSFLLLALAVHAAAQMRTSHLLRPQSLQTGLTFQHWKTGGKGEELQELVVVLGADAEVVLEPRSSSTARSERGE